MTEKKSNLIIDVGTEFSAAPAGRDYDDGPYNGLAFRERYLEPNIEAEYKTKIILDGAEAYGSSFLEEAFGGLIRKTGITWEDFNNKIELVTEDDFLLEEIKSYIEDAGNE